MSDDKPQDTLQVVKCPKCNAKVIVDEKAKSAMVATCPNGHKVELMKMV